MLDLLIFLPMILGVLARFVCDKALKIYSVACSFVILLLSGYLYIQANAGYEHVSFVALIPSLHIHYYVGFEGISALLSLLVCFMVFMSFVILRAQERLVVISMLLSLGCAMGLFASRDIVLFYTFWDLSFLPLIFLCARRGLADIAYKFFFYTFVGALLMLAGICIVQVHIYSVSGAFEFTYEAFESVFDISDDTRTLCFWLFFAAFAIKSPLFPLHTWAPDIYTRAPAIVSVMLASFKMAPFGFFLFMLGVFKSPMLANYDLLALVCVISGFYCSFLAYSSSHIKQVIAYSSIAHIGIILLGIFSSTQLSVSGAVFYMVAHGMITGLLFLLCDEIERRVGSLEISGGLAKKLPFLTFLFGFALFASISLPLTAGFIGEFLVLLGVFEHSVSFGIAATFMVVLNAIYMLSMFRRAFFMGGQHTSCINAAAGVDACISVCDIDPNKRNFRHNASFIIGSSILCAVILLISIFPNYTLEHINSSINHPFHYKLIKDKQ